MGRKSSISRLAPEVKSYIESKMADGRLTLDELLADIRARFPSEHDKGVLPGRTALHRYGAKLERRLVAVKAFTDAALAIDAHAKDEGDARSAALTAIVQQELFDAIIEIQDAGDPDADPVERVGMLSSAAKNIATLARASANTKQHQAKVEESIRRRVLEEQRAKLDALQSKGGVTAQTMTQIRRALGIDDNDTAPVAA